MHEPRLTVTGHVAAAPDLRTTPKGVAVTDFRIAHTPRVKGPDELWRDGETIWFGVTVWRGLAENVVASLRKGDRVVVDGRLSTRSYLVDGERRSNLEIDATSVGLELSRGTATYVRPARLVTDVDPMISSGQVDPATGEVLMVPAQAAGGGDEDVLEDEADEELVPA